MFNLARLSAALLLAPALAFAQGSGERSGEEIVQKQCSKCHATGAEGAPKIGARQDWIPRLKKGLEPTIRTAIKGHGNMPARGGMADLTDPEIRGAVVYMMNYGLPQPTAAATPVKQDPHRKVIGGTEVLLGFMPADVLRTHATGEEAKMHGGVPSGKGYYHINVALHDKATGKEIRDAKVSARVATPLSGETKPLNAMVINRALSYGNYFHLKVKDAHVVTLKIERPGVASPIEAKFELLP
jgi:cytochrome c5